MNNAAPLQLPAILDTAYDHNEAGLAKTLQFVPAEGLDDKQRLLFEHFALWCRQHGVRSLPARPTTISAYISAGVGDDILAEVEAIRLAHQAYQLPCPCSTDVVRARLSDVLGVKPPRSWRKDEQYLFTELPIDIQAVIAKREHEREKVLRQLQNETANLRRQAAAEMPVINTDKIEETTNEAS